MMAADRIAVIVAAHDHAATIVPSLRGFLAEVGDRGEVILVDSSRDGTAERAAAECPSVRILRLQPGLLAPELWRDGLDATDAPLVAFSHAAMVPRPGWLDALLSGLNVNQAVAAGGSIAAAPGLGGFDRALYLHRFANYDPARFPSPRQGRPHPVETVIENPELGFPQPPGDNALYRRDRLASLEPLWADGFVEPAIHRALILRGERLAFAPLAQVEFRGGAEVVPTLLRRAHHARRFGAWRAEGRSFTWRWTRAGLSPIVPLMLLGRIMPGPRASVILRPKVACPLMLLLSAWALGEAVGLIAGAGRRNVPRPLAIKRAA